jgi:WD repeat-containing protein 6
MDGSADSFDQFTKRRTQRYSARFFGNTLSTLYLGSGTVFNEVHVWKVTDKNEEGFAPVQHRLVGHDGVIFGIRFSDDGSLLVSVSDDRTIRVWGLRDQKR